MGFLPIFDRCGSCSMPSLQQVITDTKEPDVAPAPFALNDRASARQAALSLRLAISSFRPGPMVELRLIFWM